MRGDGIGNSGGLLGIRIGKVDPDNRRKADPRHRQVSSQDAHSILFGSQT
jgi:hypothetical protein